MSFSINRGAYWVHRHAGGLTETQRAAVDSEAYPFFLRAGAGTGKTEVLIQKISHIVADLEESLDNFAVITFTNKAADEMRERLYQELYRRWVELSGQGDPARAEHVRYQAEMCSMARISTIHGFCDKILRTYGMDAGISPEFKIASYRRQTQKMIGGVINKYRGNPAIKDIPGYKLTALVASLMNRNCNHGIVIDKEQVKRFRFETEDNEYFNAFKRLFLQIYLEAFETLEQEKAAAGYLALNDTVRLASEILKRPDTARKTAAQYKYLFIDEFQDVDHNQFDIVTTLIGYGTKAFIVGDEKQSIFRFRGADLHNVSDMRSSMASLKSEAMELNENFRADEALIHIINKIFSGKFRFKDQEIPFPRQPLAAPSPTKPPAAKIPFEMVYEEEIAGLIDRLIQTVTLNENSIKYDDIAILCRRNRDVDIIAEKLKLHGCPVEALGGRGFYKSKEIIDTYKLLNAVIYKSGEYIDELMFTDYFHAIASCGKGLDIGEFLRQMDVALRQSTIENALFFAFEKSNILDYYRSKNQYQAIANLYKLKNKARELSNSQWQHPIDFVNYLESMIRFRREEDEADILETDKSRGVISICSIHKAKGRSFPVVIVPFADRSLIQPVSRPKIIFDAKREAPCLAFDGKELSNKRQFIDKDYELLLDSEIISHLEEELRILYVALTRAKHKIILSSSRSKEHTSASRKISWAKWLADVL